MPLSIKILDSPLVDRAHLPVVLYANPKSNPVAARISCAHIFIMSDGPIERFATLAVRLTAIDEQRIMRPWDDTLDHAAAAVIAQIEGLRHRELDVIDTELAACSELELQLTGDLGRRPSASEMASAAIMGRHAGDLVSERANVAR